MQICLPRLRFAGLAASWNNTDGRHNAPEPQIGAVAENRSGQAVREVLSSGRLISFAICRHVAALVRDRTGGGQYDARNEALIQNLNLVTLDPT